MSSRTVYVCDVCGNDITDDRKMFGFYAQGGGNVMHIGPCCAGRTIQDLVDAYNRKYANARAPKTAKP